MERFVYVGNRRKGSRIGVLRESGHPISRDFWESPTLDELAQAQNVRPMMDVRTLFSTWPGEVDDGFEEAIDELRHSQKGRGRRWIALKI